MNQEERNPRSQADSKTRLTSVRRIGTVAAPGAQEELAVEAPLQVLVNGIPFTTTLRTPGEDRYLLRGLLHAEGILCRQPHQLVLQEAADPETGYISCLELELPEAFLAKPIESRRSLMATSSCGVCGIREVRDLTLSGAPLQVSACDRLNPSLIPVLFEQMRAGQRIFDATGGVHAAAAFDRKGRLLAVFEDIGRHNAVDKVVGWLIEHELIEAVPCLTVSGRISYEIVVKAYHAGIPFLLAVSAASSLAVETAGRFGLTLVGFCRQERATVYCNPLNLKSDGAEWAKG